jgi:RHH-type proline utilization regulon transcriptional repressor/proline dehydrogenase/delta 1-pyrroline-5-carboxylate dehydrogenase
MEAHMAKKSAKKSPTVEAPAAREPAEQKQPAVKARSAGKTAAGGGGDAQLARQVEAATQQVGRELWEHLGRRRPTIFERRWWLDHILQWAMEDESVKVQMFRFVDVLPMLRTHEQVTEHIQEYFEEVQAALPWAGRMVLKASQPGSLRGKAVALSARKNARKMAERFIAGTKVEEVLQSVTRLRKQGLAFTLDLLGEAVVSEPEADAYQKSYLDLIGGLAPLVNGWSEVPQLDRDEAGIIPRCNVSIKLSALYSRFKPIDPAGSAEGVKNRLRPVLRLAREQDAYVHVDMENYSYKDLTLEIFEQVMMEDEFRDWPDCGIVIQAYLPEAHADLERLLAWTKKRGTPIWIRLVKGAYWDYETVVSSYRGWPCPVYTEKWQSDDNFERQTEFLFRNREWLRPAIASHNLRSLAHAIAWSRALDVPRGAWEIQMLYGMAEEQQQLFSEQGHRVRVYTPFGELIPGMAYLVRRLLENTSNDSFLRHAYDDSVSVEALFRRPGDAVRAIHAV